MDIRELHCLERNGAQRVPDRDHPCLYRHPEHRHHARVAWGVRSTLQQKIVGFFLVFPTIYILNILRNVFVVTAYAEQWFPYLPEIASNGEFGYESFFWAHNVMAEFGALIFLVILAYALFTILPELGNLADGLYQLYRGEVEQIIRPKTGMSDP